MDLILVTLAAPTAQAVRPVPTVPEARRPEPGPTPIGAGLLTDILWANTTPDDLVEHINVRARADGAWTAALFLKAPTTTLARSPDTVAVALRICLSAVTTAPVLTGWTAVVDSAGLSLRS